MYHEPIELDEAAFIEQQLESFASGKLSLFVLRLEPCLASPQLRLGAPALQKIELVSHRH